MTDVAGEDCGTVTGISSNCGGLMDVVLVVQASTAVEGSHSALTQFMLSFMGRFQFKIDADGNMQPWSPRLGIITMAYGAVSDESTTIQTLTADVAALKTAINSRAASSGQLCTVCGLTLAQTLLTASGRSGVHKEVVLVVASRANRENKWPAGANCK